MIKSITKGKMNVFLTINVRLNCLSIRNGKGVTQLNCSTAIQDRQLEVLVNNNIVYCPPNI